LTNQFKKPTLATRKNQIVSKSLPGNFSRSKTLMIDADTKDSDGFTEASVNQMKKFVFKIFFFCIKD